MSANKKITPKKIRYIVALIILASLILIVYVRRDAVLLRLVVSRLLPTENIPEKKEEAKVKAEVVEQTEKPARNATHSVAGGETPKSEPKVIAEEKLPEKILIDVPFTSQAPFGKWDAYHEEACEEASLLMLAYFMQNKKLTPAVAEKEIQALIDYEIKNYGSYTDSTAEEVVRLGEEYYGLKNLRVIYDFSAQDLKKYLAEGSPIIIPAAGRLLKNPNFTSPGPLYHNLVLIGYENDTIITNDPGTRKGAGYRYSLPLLYDAIHDFTGNLETTTQGRKAMVVVVH